MTRILFAAVAALLPVPLLAGDAITITVSPAAIEIKHLRHPHAIQVLGTSAEGYSLDLRDSATFTTDNPNAATVRAGWVKPIGSGRATITVTAEGKTFAVPVTVAVPATEPPISFRHEVMPVLTWSGCNAGACHGSSPGKGGFRLSLRGADPEADFAAIVKGAGGRRINFQVPQNSLLVAKARRDLPHEGGSRFARGSLPDTILTRWIAQGVPGDLADPARVVRVTMVPDKLVLKPGQSHRIQLIAEYADGTKRDVTRFGVFAADDERFAVVDDDGNVTAGTLGETAVIGRFERVVAATTVTVLTARGEFTPTPVPDNVIDKPVIEKLNRLKIVPSEIASDEEFLRRIHLDLIGLQPKPDEVRAFLADKNPEKRENLVDALFKRPEFVDQWSLTWWNLLPSARNSVGSPARVRFREFFRSAVAANTPLDQFARQLITAQVAFSDDPASAVERVARVFCGVRVHCARCHSHPLENWTQADYFGLASFFTPVSVRPDSRFPDLADATAGPATRPRFLGGEEPKLKAGVDRRVVFAAWLTDAKNPYFARGIVNRYWSCFTHRGIIDPVDDIRSTNPPINPELLDALTEDFVKSGFDARHLIRRIVTSATYQRASAPNATNRHDDQNFSHAIPRRLPAKALLDSLAQATEVSGESPDGRSENAFPRLFGKSRRTDACERDSGSNMLQALSSLKGTNILGRLRYPGTRPALLVAKKPGDDELVTETYLWALARFPTEKEREVALGFLKARADRTTGAQDLMWALLDSEDFLLVR